MRIVREQTYGAHELPGSAKTALWPVMFNERLLQRIELLAMGKTFDGLDFSPVGPHRQVAAGVDGLAVQQHGAGSAFAAVATDLRACEAEMIAQQFGEGPTIFHVQPMPRAIHHESNRCGGNSGCYIIGYRRVRGGQIHLERGPRACHGENCAGALEKLPAGNITFAFAHSTFPGMQGGISSIIGIIYRTTAREGMTFP